MCVAASCLGGVGGQTELCIHGNSLVSSVSLAAKHRTQVNMDLRRQSCAAAPAAGGEAHRPWPREQHGGDRSHPRKRGGHHLAVATSAGLPVEAGRRPGEGLQMESQMVSRTHFEHLPRCGARPHVHPTACRFVLRDNVLMYFSTPKDFTGARRHAHA